VRHSHVTEKNNVAEEIEKHRWTNIVILQSPIKIFQMIKLYGIKNCDTVKKAIKWLADHDLEYQFHDYKKDGVDRVKLAEFVEKFGWEKLINRKGTTWRQLGEVEQKKIINDKYALKLMCEKPSVIKRPIVDIGSKQLIGFEVEEYENILSKL
jgi:arsenate reductase (glutaredoxin)